MAGKIRRMRARGEPEIALLGTGLYSVRQASLLAQIPARSIRRWLFGYRYLYEGQAVEQPAVVRSQFADYAREHKVISFHDLIELMFVRAFRSEGVSWPTIRRAADRARELTGSDHPFASQRFVTDGETIFAEIASSIDGTELLDLKRDQMAFRRVLLRSLRARLDVGTSGAERWWPLGKQRPVVIDPARQFGQPITADEGVPTAVLAKAYDTIRSVARVADWYCVSQGEVKAAIEFEQRIAEQRLAA